MTPEETATYHAAVQSLRAERKRLEPTEQASYTTYVEARQKGYHDGAEVVRDNVMVELVKLTDAVHTLRDYSLPRVLSQVQQLERAAVTRDVTAIAEAIEAIEDILLGRTDA